MTSPFLGFDNSVLSFEIADSYIINELGNYTSQTKLVEIRAVLKVTTNQTTLARYTDQIQQFAGADGYTSILEGYLVDPTTYPPGLEFLAQGDIQILSTLGKTETGQFKLLPINQSPYVATLGIDLITPIVGIFRKN